MDLTLPSFFGKQESEDYTPELEAEIELQRTPPGAQNTLLLQPEADFILNLKYTGDNSYSGEIQFRIPDPFEVRIRSRPKEVDWNYEEQILYADKITGELDVLMKVLLPSKYRGEREGCLVAVESSDDDDIVLCKRTIRSDSPLHRT